MGKTNLKGFLFYLIFFSRKNRWHLVEWIFALALKVSQSMFRFSFLFLSLSVALSPHSRSNIEAFQMRFFSQFRLCVCVFSRSHDLYFSPWMFIETTQSIITIHVQCETRMAKKMKPLQKIQITFVFSRRASFSGWFRWNSSNEMRKVSFDRIVSGNIEMR